MRYLLPYFIENLQQNLDSTDQLSFYQSLRITYPKTYDGKEQAWKNLSFNFNALIYETASALTQFRYQVDLLSDFTVRIKDMVLSKELQYAANEKLCVDAISSTTHLVIISRDRKLNYHIQILLKKDLELVNEFIIDYTLNQSYKFSLFNEQVLTCYSNANARFISFIEIPSGKVIFSHKIEEESTELHRLKSLTHNHYYVRPTDTDSYIDDSYIDVNNATKMKIIFEELMHQTSIDHQTVDVQVDEIIAKLTMVKCNLSCDDLTLRLTLYHDFCIDQKIELKEYGYDVDIKFPYLTFLNSTDIQDQWECFYLNLLTKEWELFYQSTRNHFSFQKLGIINDDKYQLFCLSTSIYDPKFPNSNNVLQIFDLNSRKLIFEQGLKFMFDGDTTGFRYNYHKEALMVVGYDGPNYVVDLKTMKLIDYYEVADRFGNLVHLNTYFLKDSVIFIWIDEHLFPLSKEIEDGIERGWAQLDSD